MMMHQGAILRSRYVRLARLREPGDVRVKSPDDPTPEALRGCFFGPDFAASELETPPASGHVGEFDQPDNAAVGN